MGGYRRSTRLVDFDYRWGSFFVSIVAFNREPIFGTLVNQTVQRSRLGDIVVEEWMRTAAMRPSVQLDEWIVMPDHFQAILIINETMPVGGARGAPTRPWRPNPSHVQHIGSIQPTTGSLPKIINQFKSATTRRINAHRQTTDQPVWQRNYHDRIIRNIVELNRVRRYIRDNPKNA